MKLLNSSSSHGWVQACANGRLGGMGGLRDGVGMGGFIIYP